MDVTDYGPLLTAEAFLEIDFGERIKAELEDGELRVLNRGPGARVRVATNLQCLLHQHFRCTGRRTYGPLALKTSARCVRFPDAAVYETVNCVAQCDDRDLMSDPILAAHVVPTDRMHSRLADEYKLIGTLRALLLVDFERERIRALDRAPGGEWQDWDIAAGDLVILPSLDLTIPHADIFARD